MIECDSFGRMRRQATSGESRTAAKTSVAGEHEFTNAS